MCKWNNVVLAGSGQTAGAEILAPDFLGAGGMAGVVWPPLTSLDSHEEKCVNTCEAFYINTCKVYIHKMSK